MPRRLEARGQRPQRENRAEQGKQDGGVKPGNNQRTAHQRQEAGAQRNRYRHHACRRCIRQCRKRRTQLRKTRYQRRLQIKHKHAAHGGGIGRNQRNHKAVIRPELHQAMRARTHARPKIDTLVQHRSRAQPEKHHEETAQRTQQHRAQHDCPGRLIKPGAVTPHGSLSQARRAERHGDQQHSQHGISKQARRDARSDHCPCPRQCAPGSFHHMQITERKT